MSPTTTFCGLLLAVCGLFISGCGTVTVRMRGIAPLNVNATGESTPVDVRVYTLNSDAKFRGAAFEMLWTDASTTLVNEMIGNPVQAAVYPGGAGDTPTSVEVKASDSDWIGVIALYRGTDGLPRTIVVRATEADDKVLELTGYNLRWEGTNPTGTVQSTEAAPQPEQSPPTVKQKNQGR